MKKTMGPRTPPSLKSSEVNPTLVVNGFVCADIGKDAEDESVLTAGAVQRPPTRFTLAGLGRNAPSVDALFGAES